MNWNKVINRIKAFLNKTKHNKSYVHSTQEGLNTDPWLGTETIPQDNFVDSQPQYDDVHEQHNTHNHSHHEDHTHHHNSFSDHTCNNDSTFSGGHFDHGSFDSGSTSMPDSSN